jgi:hypothetical protein
MRRRSESSMLDFTFSSSVVCRTPTRVVRARLLNMGNSGFAAGELARIAAVWRAGSRSSRGSGSWAPWLRRVRRRRTCQYARWAIGAFEVVNDDGNDSRKRSSSPVRRVSMRVGWKGLERALLASA